MSRFSRITPPAPTSRVRTRRRALYRATFTAALVCVALPACASSARPEIEFPEATSEDLIGFSLEPSRPEDQWQLSQRFTLGNGVNANDFWAEYWAWRAARQGHAPALEWLEKEARRPKWDQPGLIVFRNVRRIEKERPSAGLWFAVSKPIDQRTEEDAKLATDLVDEALPELLQKATRGDPWSKYLVGLTHEVAFDEPEAAFTWYTEAANLGHALSQDALARLYDAGRGTAQSSTEAAHWFREAAEQGYAPSATMLGYLYDHGRGVPQDPREAIRWFAVAAKQGDALAQTNLGLMLERGRGTNADPTEAVRWYRKGAAQGVAVAENQLGTLYATGRGVEQDPAEALRWYQRAADHGYTEAQEHIDLIAARRSMAQGDFRVATGLVVRAAVGGDAGAQYNLATRYERGEGLRQNLAEAVRWYKQAVAQGHRGAQTNLGVLYHEGRGIERNDAEAVRLFGLAAAQGDVGAQYNLGTMHESGYGVPKDSRAALEWYRRAAQGGHAGAKAAAQEIECELSASTELFGALLLCSNRDAVRRAARSAGATVVEESSHAGPDTYQTSLLFNAAHVLRVEYDSGGRIASVSHELPEKADFALQKRIATDLLAHFGTPDSSEPRNAKGETHQTWMLRDRVKVEFVRAGAKGALTFTLP